MSAARPTRRSGSRTCSPTLARAAGTASSWTTPTPTCRWHLNGRHDRQYQTPAAWRAATRSMLATVGPALKLGQGCLAVPNLSAPVGRRLRRAGDLERLAPVHLGRRRRSTTRSGARTAPSWFAGSDWTYRQRFQTLTEQAGKIFIGITYAPKSDDAVDGVGARELPALRRACEQQRPDVRAQRPGGAGPVRARLDGRRRLARSGPASRSARPGGATSAAARCSSTRPARRSPRRPRAAVPTRRRLLGDLGHARPDERRDPALLVQRGGSAPPPPAPPPPAAPPSLSASVSGMKSRAPLGRPQGPTRRRLPQAAGRKATVANSGSLHRRSQAQAGGDVLPTRSALPAPRRVRARSV